MSKESGVTFDIYLQQTELHSLLLQLCHCHCVQHSCQSEHPHPQWRSSVLVRKWKRSQKCLLYVHSKMCCSLTCFKLYLQFLNSAFLVLYDSSMVSAAPTCPPDLLPDFSALCLQITVSGHVVKTPCCNSWNRKQNTYWFGSRDIPMGRVSTKDPHFSKFKSLLCLVPF